MHGRKREEEGAPGLSVEALAARAAKIAKYNAAKGAFLTMRAARQMDERAVALTKTLIELNPDFYSLWNFRKEIIINMVEKDPPSQLPILEGELSLATTALMKNPKCYSAWHHRLWVLQRAGGDTEGGRQLRLAELQLCSKMLALDARNFHCWNYRRAVAKLCDADPQSEFAFTTEKINENFSNYSAWHYRTVLIPRLFPAAALASDASLRARYEEALDAEFHLVRQAFYTEPEDQSAWLYHRWLLGRVVAEGGAHKDANKLPVLGISLGTHLFDEQQQQMQQGQESLERESAGDVAPAAVPAPSSSASSALLSRQLAIFRRELHEVSELLSVEEDCKWALLTSAVLQAGVVACLHAQQQQAPQAGGESGAPVPSAAEVAQEVSELSAAMKTTFERLVELDPLRRNYYLSVRQRFLSGNEGSDAEQNKQQ